MVKIANLLIILTFFAHAACAENATAPVNSPQGLVDSENNAANDDHDDEHEEHLELMALTYEGRDPFGTSCVLHISGFEEEHDGGHHHELIAKLDYSLHGETPLDTIVTFQRYNLNTNTYYPVDSNEVGTVPVLVSAVLKDENIAIDYNKLLEYEQSGVLLQSIRADLNDINFVSFESALDEVLENNNSFDSNKSMLDQLQRTVLKIAHAGHYDAVACSNFKLTGMEVVEFKLGGEHDDDDDDHDHDH